ncbi:MAG TPA: tRNA pseudouridine(38-40) synthase TruA [Desulfomonilaceae bacterium]|nr:tRNA pseudouridine(38-40) synthase TruA [Desulfomonilaceae bacterium]
MNKYVALLEYDGTAYHGWQLQKDLPTVQGVVEQGLQRILTTATRVHGAGRTDAGVHASGQVAHFFAEWKHSPQDLLRACNAVLPADVSIRSVKTAPEDFHARHSARSKIYVYSILNSSLRSPLQRLYSWHIPHELDVGAMKHAMECLPGTHDFGAFGSPTEGTPSTVRQMLSAELYATERGYLRVTLQGTGFLRYMVRSLVGTLVLVGRNNITPSEFRSILVSTDRSRSGPTAPPHGLCLRSVQYDPGGKG